MNTASATTASAPADLELVDVDDVLRRRAPKLRRRLPRMAVRWLERWICQDEINRVIEATRGLEGADFCAAALSHEEVTYELVNPERLQSSEPVTIVSNHPLGALDGICLIDAMTRAYGCPVKFPVNDLLMAIIPLRSVFIPINKHGRQSREAAAAIDQAFASKEPVLMFPAGLCSRKGKDGVIADLTWHKMFLLKSLPANRRIIPVYFDGQNSKFFYNLARLRQRLGISFNLEMLCLPREIFRCRGRHYRITVGQAVNPAELLELCGGDATEAASRLKSIVYSLKT
jgi:putative hemolysin